MAITTDTNMRDPHDVKPGDKAASGAAEPTKVETDQIDDAVARAFEDEVAAANRRADENWDKYLRAEAELENYRRVAERRRAESSERGRRQLLEAFLEVADNLERALTHADSNPDAVVEGVEATYRALGRLLEREGVQTIQALGGAFDPALHEAVGVVNMPDVEGETVVAVERPGYTVGDDLLRPARVVVGRPAS